jgi:hypothetical protein
VTRLRGGDKDLHNDDGSHRSTSASTSGHAIGLWERRIKRHLDEHRQPWLTAVCSVCGQRVQRNGVSAPWRHQRPQPSGAPHDHRPVPKRERS